MQKLDRLGWAAGFVLSSFGVRVGIRVNDAAALHNIRELLPPGWTPAASPVVEKIYSLILGGPDVAPNIRRLKLLYGNEVRLARARDAEPVYDALERELPLYIAEMAPRRVFVHAGVVGWRGRAIVMPGKTFTGKSTLVTEFVRAGAEYYSDEYAVLDAGGRVYPYARPLALREGGLGRPTRRSAASLGGSVGSAPLPVGLVLATEYRHGRRWRTRPLTPGEGALILLGNVVGARRKPEKVLAALQPVVMNAALLKGPRGEAREVVDSTLGSTYLNN